jgi:cobalt/nickel transport system permease protein
MHIADGILPAPVCIAAHAVALGGVTLLCRNVDSREVPRMGLTAAMTFAASLIHFPLGGTSMHLGLYGLAGILLGPRAFVVVYASLLLQAVLFQHGGLLTLGVNVLNMGSGALLAWLCWKLPGLPGAGRAFLAGFVGAQIPALLMAGEFALTGYGKGFFVIAGLYLALALLEGGITSATVAFLDRTQPRVLNGFGQDGAAATAGATNRIQE